MKESSPPVARGIHFVTIYAEGNGADAPIPVATVPYIAPYPREYRELKPNLSLLSRLAEETGGEMIDPEKFQRRTGASLQTDAGKSYPRARHLVAAGWRRINFVPCGFGS